MCTSPDCVRRGSVCATVAALPPPVPPPPPRLGKDATAAEKQARQEVMAERRKMQAQQLIELKDQQRLLENERQRLEAGPKVPRMCAVRGRPMGRTEGESSSERLEHLNGSQTVATNEHSSDGCNTEFIQIYMYATMQRN